MKINLQPNLVFMASKLLDELLLGLDGNPSYPIFSVNAKSHVYFHHPAVMRGNPSAKSIGVLSSRSIDDVIAWLGVYLQMGGNKMGLETWFRQFLKYLPVLEVSGVKQPLSAVVFVVKDFYRVDPNQRKFQLTYMQSIISMLYAHTHYYFPGQPRMFQDYIWIIDDTLLDFGPSMLDDSYLFN